jgi:hypothetical protein
VGIRKSEIVLDDCLFDWIRDEFLTAPRREAEKRYRHGNAAAANAKSDVRHSSSSKAISAEAGVLRTPKIKNIDEAKGTTEVVRNGVTSEARINVIPSGQNKALQVTTGESLEHGVLWEPVVVEGSVGVRLNTGHSFYQSVYMPNQNNLTVVRALDFMLWSLANAEINNSNDQTRDAFEEFRVEVSRNLKKLVTALPMNDKWPALSKELTV